MAEHNSFDSLLPAEMATKAEQVGVNKANLPAMKLFVLAVLAGAFIAIGAIFATTVVTGGSELPYGVAKLLAGAVFSLGLILVVVGGAELFTGNNLIVMAWANNKVGTQLLVRNWGIVYAGNFVGSFGMVVLIYFSGHYEFGEGQVGLSALKIADAKVQLDFLPAVMLGILCNVLVCLAIWLSFSARTTGDKILAIVPPVAAFVAAGFEHCVANMYFVPVAILIKNGASEKFWQGIGASSSDFAELTWRNFFVNNLVPVTIGNVIGGAVLVGIVYWFVYLKPAKNV